MELRKMHLSMLCSDPEGLEHADLNVTVFWASLQIIQFFITWILWTKSNQHTTLLIILVYS